MDWKLTSEMTTEERYDGGYLLHGPALVHLDFNPEGVERGYWQDSAWPGTRQTDGAAYFEATGQKEPDEAGPGAWSVPGWDSNGDVYFTRFIGPDLITHYMKVPEGPHSGKHWEEPDDRSDAGAGPEAAGVHTQAGEVRPVQGG